MPHLEVVRNTAPACNHRSIAGWCRSDGSLSIAGALYCDRHAVMVAAEVIADAEVSHPHAVEQAIEVMRMALVRACAALAKEGT